MNTADVLVLVVLLLNGVIGAFRGFVWQAFRIGSLVLAFWLGHRFAPAIADGPLTRFEALDETGRKVVAWVGVLVAVYVVMHVIGHWLRALINKARLSSADRALGFLLGGVKGGVFVALAFQVLLVFFPFLPAEVATQLRGGPEGTPPPSQAFALHHRLLAERMNELMPGAMKKELDRGLAAARTR